MNRRLGCESKREISFVSFVRACEAVWAREKTILQPLGWANSRFPTALNFFTEFCGGLKEVMKCDQQLRGFKEIDDIRSTVQGF